jgi:hypothetical protein
MWFTYFGETNQYLPVLIPSGKITFLKVPVSGIVAAILLLPLDETIITGQIQSYC